VVTTSLAAWRRDASALRLSALAVGLVGASVLAVSRVVEGLFPYVVRWSAVVGFTVGLAIAWTAWRAVRPSLSRRAVRAVGTATLAGLVVISAANLWAGVTTPPHDDDKSVTVRDLAAAVAPRLDRSAPVVVETPDPTGGVEALWMLPAVALQLERQGFDVRVDDTRFTNRAPRGDERQAVALHHVSADAPTVPQLADVAPAAARDDMVVWVVRRTP
jgi:hypothetical protein